jgi:hypothetical protein
MRSAILLGAFFIGNSLTHIKPEVIPAIAGVLVAAFLWDVADSLINWRCNGRKD